jgi:hypothetical protein
VTQHNKHDVTLNLNRDEAQRVMAGLICAARDLRALREQADYTSEAEVIRGYQDSTDRIIDRLRLAMHPASKVAPKEPMTMPREGTKAAADEAAKEIIAARDAAEAMAQARKAMAQAREAANQQDILDGVDGYWHNKMVEW